ncbi:lipoprotein N-acyltransferase Lnb domain-containing protein [Thiomicrolovo sp. ZZH C-3]
MRWLSALLLLLLGGCAFRDPAPDAPLHSLSLRQWETLATTLQQVPDPLQRAIREEALPRLAISARSTQTDVGSEYNATETLSDLIQQSRTPLLSADEEFRRRLALLEASPSPQHAFADALAGFLLEPDYPCRHPVYSAYFQARYGLPVPRCTEPLPFLVVSRTEGLVPFWLAPERLYAIHLLFAGEGSAMASRFGHVALRLVICPEGETSPEACESNLYGHLVLGYMAHIDEFELNSVKALSGAYRAHLFAFPFMDVYRGYAIDEFRELYSLPLTLNRAQLQTLLRQLDEIHWRFEGDYSFFSRNCATLMQMTLRALLPGYTEQPISDDDYLRPDTFFEAMRETPLVEGERLASLAQAEEGGYYFSSTEGYYEAALKAVLAGMTSPAFDDIDTYLARPPEVRFETIAGDRNYRERLGREPHLLEAQILLEELALLRGERRLQALGSRYLNDYGDQLQSAETLEPLSGDDRAFFRACFLQSVRLVTAAFPTRRAIPDRQSTLPSLPRPALCREEGAPARLNAILTAINRPGSDQWQQLIYTTRLLDETTGNILKLQEIPYDTPIR